MDNKLGVMQGRLLPKYQGRYQAFPVGCWADEFSLAQGFGLDLIEFILDYNGAEDNPLLRTGGCTEISLLSNQTGVFVETVCADYFMEAPLHSEDMTVVRTSVDILNRLIESANRLQIRDIVLPCVEQSSLKAKGNEDRLVDVLNSFIPVLQSAEVNICLETDLPPQAFLSLLDRLPFDCITVNYDIGNSASLGFCVETEFNAYGHRVTDVHIKDRVLRGGPVPLGTGSANFQQAFSTLKKIQYTGPLIMQAYRDDEGIGIFKEQLAYVKALFDE